MKTKRERKKREFIYNRKAEGSYKIRRERKVAVLRAHGGHFEANLVCALHKRIPRPERRETPSSSSLLPGDPEPHVD